MNDITSTDTLNTTLTSNSLNTAQTSDISRIYGMILQLINKIDPAIADAIKNELHDQRRALKLIASENYASLPVLLSMGNWLSDKYAEGVAGRRFYAGCQNVDTVERLAAKHACELFGAEYAYVQPHSGIDANLVAYWAILSEKVEIPELSFLNKKTVNDLTDEEWRLLRHKLGNQRLLGMSLDAGGHLTHGFRHNISGKMFEQASYSTDPQTGLLDYDALLEQAEDFKPLIIVAGYSAYPRRVNFAKMRAIADAVGAVLMVDMAHFAGLVAGKVFQNEENPIPYADIVTTTTHKSLRGPRGGLILAKKAFSQAIDRGCPMVLGGPLPHVMAAKALALAEAKQPEFTKYAKQIVENAQALAAALQAEGVKLVTDGTDNHLLIMDVNSSFNLTGRQAEQALLECNIVTNRNAIPRDPNGAWYTSGVRMGTPALTSRACTVDDMQLIAKLIVKVLRNTAAEVLNGQTSKAKYTLAENIKAEVRAEISNLLAARPLYPELEL